METMFEEEPEVSDAEIDQALAPLTEGMSPVNQFQELIRYEAKNSADPERQ